MLALAFLLFVPFVRGLSVSSALQKSSTLSLKEYRVHIVPPPPEDRARRFGGVEHLETFAPFSLRLLEATLETQDTLVSEALDPAVHKNAPNSDPYGVVLWPAAIPVASMVASLVSSGAVRRVIEIGTGTGLVSLAAVASGAECVVATDYNPATLEILDQAAKLNFESDVDVDEKGNIGKLVYRNVLSIALFDVTDMDAEIPIWPASLSTSPSSESTSDLEWVEMDCPCSDFDNPAPSESSDRISRSVDASSVCDLLVCADLLYTPRTARALAQRCATLLKEKKTSTSDAPPGSSEASQERPWRVLVGDCGRPGAAAFVDELQRLGLLAVPATPECKTTSSGIEQKLAGFRPVAARTLIGERHDLIATEHKDEKPLTVGVIELGPWS